jgi:ankyrin repeat protein
LYKVNILDNIVAHKFGVQMNKKILTIIMLITLPIIIFADVNNGWTPLHDAIYNGNTKKITKLITKDSVTKESKAGVTPLHLAVKMRQLGTVQKLIDAGADIDAQDKSGQTALHYALAQRLNKIAKILIKKDADMDLGNNSGITPLHQAAYKGDTDMVQYMIDNGATVDVKNKQGTTPCQLSFIKQNMSTTSLLQQYTKLPCGIKSLKKGVK